MKNTNARIEELNSELELEAEELKELELEAELQAELEEFETVESIANNGGFTIDY